MKTDSFPDWLQRVLNERDMNQTDLANAAKVGTGSISDILSGRRKVGRRLAEKIAKGLKLPVEQVYRAAGFLSSNGSDVDEQIEEINHLAKELSPDDRNAVIEFIRMLDRLRGHKK